MLDNYYLEPDDFFKLIFRLFLALLIGAIIGIERELRRKPAGLRTHMLVSFGSAIFVVIPLQIISIQSHPEVVSRVIQGIAAGVGFLGAGEIVRESSQQSQRLEIHGLTSAAAIWVSSGLGIAAGCGLWQLSLVGAIITFAVLNIFKRLENS
ncbi:MgtC/SapB family protein [Anabaena sp. FACHB-709]|uniref:MgtC/SapB transporter n=2 Tax=Nostocaceae TaxID=1162 RepID=A0A1Z4KJ67_ANAVA|nr:MULTISPECIES: MgtC/SapB family protein [Nostocaceae]BAY69026.1 MgtC/SapB transporter [Trichormus variabilis NIES-23]HBW30249.1 MgtC/SapB family protein [Nostoc sp. UBA8866]MBD2173813.1 MgtC/SapB family protein [Anabaena cylindrica FACHB-318]MBD2265624.1 MgtC/SapB family protein [Anabaena sp. FACHB-709]MBD2274853.1 MgtC/SapB family protein [Nostoc sp. PCC 7120 = FACHB-418]